MCFIQKPSYFIKILSSPISRCRKTFRQTSGPLARVQRTWFLLHPALTCHGHMSHEAHFPHSILQAPEEQDSCSQATLQDRALPCPCRPSEALLRPQAHRALPSFPDLHLSSQRRWPCVRGIWTPTATPRAEAGRSPVSHIPGNSGEGWCGSRTLTFFFKGSQKQ